MNTQDYKNPFAKDSDRGQIWEMLVQRDVIAFMGQDWDMIKDDFLEEEFMGIDGNGKSNADSWTLLYAKLDNYKNLWLDQAKDFAETSWAGDAEQAIYEATNLRDIDISGNAAVAHKKFDGYIMKRDGNKQIMNWQTLYRCRKVNGVWKIQGFLGYLPYPFKLSGAHAPGNAINIPPAAAQHVTAGPYSPVLEVTPSKIVVISGQASIDKSGTVIGTTIEEQTKLTMENCAAQLKEAGCTLDDVFKVNAYLTDLDNWPRFNEVYKTYFNHPLPVRTAVQTPLLMTLLIEIEMWAAKS